MQPHLDPREQSVGTGIWVTHGAATPPGFTVTVEVTVQKVDGRRLVRGPRARRRGRVGPGTHERFVIDRERFVRKVREKAAAGL
jgi:fluoroacetyl-CoA thioesterase